jgi:plastocyanin
MPVRGRSILLAAAVAGSALGAGPAVGAKHRKARWVAIKARTHGHTAARGAGRPPLVGTQPVTTPATTTPTTTDPTTPAPICPTALGVTEDEYHTYVSRSTLCPGSILIQLRNTGEDPHNLEVLNLDTSSTVATWDDAGPGDVVTKRVTLVAGSYRLFCTLPTHDELGMHTVITVG